MRPQSRRHVTGFMGPCWEGATIRFSVFTKPWPKLEPAVLGAFVRDLGFEWIELPVRPGFQVEPENAGRDLPRAARALADAGVGIASVAGPADEPTLAACAQAGVPLLRVMYGVAAGEGYLAAEARARADLERLVPLCERYGVSVGVQNHSGRFVAQHAAGLCRLLAGLPVEHVGAIWDAAHNALEGEPVDFGVELVWPHLLMVNLKNGYKRRVNGPEAARPEWRTYWTGGRYGLCSWGTVARALHGRGYDGTVCLTAEYSAEAEVDRLTREDLAYARSVFAAADRPG